MMNTQMEIRYRLKKIYSLLYDYTTLSEEDKNLAIKEQLELLGDIQDIRILEGVVWD